MNYTIINTGRYNITFLMADGSQRVVRARQSITAWVGDAQRYTRVKWRKRYNRTARTERTRDQDLNIS